MAVGEPYLLQPEYETFGLPADADPDLVWQACLLVDLFCHRTTSATFDVDGVVNGLWNGDYKERRRLFNLKNDLRVMYRPARQLLTLRGRVIPGRRDENIYQQYPDAAILTGTTNLSGVPQWTDINIADALLEDDARLWVPTSLFGLPWNEVEVTYKAGYDVIPDRVKMAVGFIYKNLPQNAYDQIRGDFMEMQEGDIRAMRFPDTKFIPREAIQLLMPDRIRSLL